MVRGWLARVVAQSPQEQLPTRASHGRAGGSTIVACATRALPLFAAAVREPECSRSWHVQCASTTDAHLTRRVRASALTAVVAAAHCLN